MSNIEGEKERNESSGETLEAVERELKLE